MRKVLLILATLLLVLSACSGKEKAGTEVSKEQLDNLTDSGFPIVKKPLTLKMFAAKGANTLSNWNDILVWNTYEEMTGIHVEFEQVAGDALEEKRNLALAGGSLPDVFYAANLPTLDIYKYGQQGVFLKLNDLIDEHAPNLSRMLDENPDIKKAITFPDGNIYSLPVIYDPDFIALKTGPMLYYHKDVLDQVGMDIPQTTDQFYEYLKAVKEKTDYTPYGGHNMATLADNLRGAFGVATTGRAYIDKDPASGDIRFYPTTDQYKELLQYVHKLYSEKLIDQNIFTIEWQEFLTNGIDQDYSSMIFYAPIDLFGAETGEKYIGGVPLEGPNGDRKHGTVGHPVAHIGKFAITNVNPNPAASMRWVDHFYSDEGSRLWYMGVEGETYEVVDGEYKYMDHITNSKEGLTKEQEIVKYLGWIGMGAPGVLRQDYFDGSESSKQSLETAAKVEPFLPDEVWPPFTYTEEEANKLSALAADIEKYVTEMRDKFLVGDEDFANWDKYVNTINQMGLEEYMKIQAAAFKRYQEN